jgi:hypothetical protein
VAIYECSKTNHFLYIVVGLMMTQDEPKQGYCFYNAYCCFDSFNYYHIVSQMTQRDIFHQDGEYLVYARNQL